MVGIMLVFIVPIMAFVFVFGPAALLVYGVGGMTGLTAAWGNSFFR